MRGGDVPYRRAAGGRSGRTECGAGNPAPGVAHRPDSSMAAAGQVLATTTLTTHPARAPVSGGAAVHHTVRVVLRGRPVTRRRRRGRDLRPVAARRPAGPDRPVWRPGLSSTLRLPALADADAPPTRSSPPSSSPTTSARGPEPGRCRASGASISSRRSRSRPTTTTTGTTRRASRRTSSTHGPSVAGRPGSTPPAASITSSRRRRRSSRSGSARSRCSSRTRGSRGPATGCRSWTPAQFEALRAWVHGLPGPGALVLGQPIFTAEAGLKGYIADWGLPDYHQYRDLVALLASTPPRHRRPDRRRPLRAGRIVHAARRPADRR